MQWSDWEEVSGFTFTDIRYEKKRRAEGGQVARITIDRPERLNAFTDHTIKEWNEAFDDASNDALVGVVVLTGAGDRAFSAGGDIKWEGVRTRAQFFMDDSPARALRLCRKPVIAAVKGYAIGGGNLMSYFCDITIAGENAIFGQNGPVVASPADGYIVRYLVRVVGIKKAREIWMLCRRYGAQEALDMGLVNAVVPVDQVDAEVDKWSDEILAKNPTCIEILKASFDAEIDEMVGSFRRYVQLVAPDFPLGPEVQEAQQAFWEKRPPNFWQFREGMH